MKKYKTTNKAIYQLQAEVCQCLAHPKRLEILDILKDKELSATKIAVLMGISKANLSQHLLKMRESGILSSRKEGLNIFYSLANPKVTQACCLMKEVLRERMDEQDRFRKDLKF